jgi:hypothetical protein
MFDMLRSEATEMVKVHSSFARAVHAATPRLPRVLTPPLCFVELHFEQMLRLAF